MGLFTRQIVMEEADAMIDEATLQHFILGMMMALTYPTFRRFKYPYLGLILIHPWSDTDTSVYYRGGSVFHAGSNTGYSGCIGGFGGDASGVLFCLKNAFRYDCLEAFFILPGREGIEPLTY
jgi:hypothetical protein